MNRATWSPAEPAAAVVEPPVVAPVIPEPEPTLSAEEPKPEGEPKPPVEAKEPKAEEPPVEGEPKPEDEPKPEGAPEAYELKAPDGQELDPAAVALAAPIFKELGLTNENAQKVVSLYAEQILPAVGQQVQAQTLALLGMDGIGGWREASEKDPEFGLAKFDETKALVAKARDQFASPALREFLEKSRMGNHPEWIRMMAKVGRAISEGSFETGDPGAKQEQYLHQKLYGEEYQAKG